MRSLARLMLLAMASFPTFAAARAMYVTHLDGTAAIFVDMDSVSRSAPVVSFEETVLYATPIKSGNLAAAYTVNRIAMDCAAGKARTEDAMVYSADGSPFLHRAGAGDWRPIQAGTTGAHEQSLVCDGRYDLDFRPSSADTPKLYQFYQEVLARAAHR